MSNIKSDIKSDVNSGKTRLNGNLNGNKSNANGGGLMNPSIPTAEQLAEARRKQWHQQGEALLTVENLRSWLNAAGLVLFAPRPQIVAPAPSLVEAVLGEANASPTLEQIGQARGLLARLVAEGLAAPLNLLGISGPGLAGGIGETPDFVCSAAVFSYVFTLRGDKAWKQPPVTSGALKVSPLALAAYEALTRRGTLSAYDLATELGKEVTEAAVLRALGELWTHLRVLPVTDPTNDGHTGERRPAVWELASARFTKQIKAGANAGQPTALSALISLYLGQAVVASEEEIESFLSPLAARSRIRDVMHALLGAGQLSTLAVEGRTVLHVAGELPGFAAAASMGTAVVSVPERGDETADEAIAVEGESGDAGTRITKYVPKPRKVGTGYLAKASPAKFAGKAFGRAKPGGAGFGGAGFSGNSGFQGGDRTGLGGRSGFSGRGQERERRPFKKAEGGGGASDFARPWEEERARKRAAAARPSEVADAGSAGVDAPAPGTADLRASAAPARAPRKSFSKPGTFARKREGFAGKAAFGGGRREREPRSERRDFAPRGAGPASKGSRDRGEFRPGADRFQGTEGRGFPARPQGDRAPRRESSGFAPRKPYPPRGAGFFSGKPRQADDRAERAGRLDQAGSGARGREGRREDKGPATESGKRVYRKFDAPRERPARSFSSDRPVRAERKEGGEFAPRKFAGKPASRPSGYAGKAGTRPGGGFAEKAGGFAGKKIFSKLGGGSADRAKSGFAGKAFAGKAKGGFAGRPGSTFAKFADGKKPFGKRPPARKFKAKEDGAA